MRFEAERQPRSRRGHRLLNDADVPKGGDIAVVLPTYAIYLSQMVTKTKPVLQISTLLLHFDKDMRRDLGKSTHLSTLQAKASE
jgi:hypothetical protein